MKPNTFTIYVSNTTASERFYSGLFEMSPMFVHESYVAYALGDGITLGLWSGANSQLDPNAARTNELGIDLDGGGAAVEELWAAWSTSDATIVEPLHNKGFGPTFVVADPDGNLIRVTPKLEV